MTLARLPASVAVLMSWWLWHRDWRLSRSSDPPSRMGFMWSTTLAGLAMPMAMQWTQQCWSRCIAAKRMAIHLRPRKRSRASGKAARVALRSPWSRMGMATRWERDWSVDPRRFSFAMPGGYTQAHESKRLPVEAGSQTDLNGFRGDGKGFDLPRYIF